MASGTMIQASIAPPISQGLASAGAHDGGKPVEAAYLIKRKDVEDAKDIGGIEQQHVGQRRAAEPAAAGDQQPEQQQVEHNHILDPGTGMPSKGPHGVTLVARGVDDINGLGAAIMVAGEAAGRHWLEALPGVDAMIVGPGTRRWLSAGMAIRRIT